MKQITTVLGAVAALAVGAMLPGLPTAAQPSIASARPTATDAQLSGIPYTSTDPWGAFKNTADRLGRTWRIGPQTNHVAWQYVFRHFGIQSPAVVAHDGSIYVGSAVGIFYAFTPDGHIKWSMKLTRFEITAAPAIGPDGTIYIVPENGDLHAFNPDGSQKWVFPMHGYGGPSSSPIVGPDGVIYTGADRLYAVNTDGTRRWTYNTGSYMEGPAAIARDGSVYVPSQGYLYALDRHGALKWRASSRAEYPLGSAAAIGRDGTIYINTNDGVLHAFAPDGGLRWTFTTEGIVMDVPSSPAIGKDGTIYFGGGGQYNGMGGYFYAVNPDGSLKWKYFAGCDQTAPSIGGDGTIYFGSNGCGTISALNQDGTPKWVLFKNAYMRSAPAIGAGGRLYAGWLGDPNLSPDGGLLAVGP